MKNIKLFIILLGLIFLGLFIVSIRPVSAYIWNYVNGSITCSISPDPATTGITVSGGITAGYTWSDCENGTIAYVFQLSSTGYRIDGGGLNNLGPTTTQKGSNDLNCNGIAEEERYEYSYSNNIDISGFSNGQHSITIEANDNSGNYSKICNFTKTTATPTHKECNANNQCVSVTGAGADTCATNADCAPPICNCASYGIGWHDPDFWGGCGDCTSNSTNNCKPCGQAQAYCDGCNWNTVWDPFKDEAYTGTGPGHKCPGSPCITATHQECNASNQCVSVTGAGADTCATNADCAPPTHKACNANDQCVSVTGAGADTCTTNADCAPPTLSVTLSASPNSGTAPLNDVVLTADPAGTATGTINYTFYCNRSDSDTNITDDYAHKKDGIPDDPYSAPAGVCDSVYKNPDSYTAKVIVERDSMTTEATTTVLVVQGVGTIQVKATLDGNVWSGDVGDVNYTLSGRDTVVGTVTPANYFNVSVGSYTISVTSGGPENTILDSVSPAASLLVLANQTTTFTLNFKTIIGPTYKACNVSNQCATLVGAGDDTCTDDASCIITHKACNASDQCVYVAGSGGDTCTDDASCIITHKACNASDQCVYVAGSGPDLCIKDTSCKPTPPPPFVCNFYWSPESPKAKSTVDFFDNTYTPEGTTLTSWVWTFQDGTPLSSSVQSPGGVIFNSAGVKTVTLKATNSDNEVCTLNQEITVQSLNPKWIEVIPK